MSALPPLNWQRVSSSEDNSVLLILCISAGELNHLPALFTCHLGDEANSEGIREQAGPIAKQPRRACHNTLPWLISFSLGLWRTLHETSTLYSCPRLYSGPYERRAKAERERQSPNKCPGGHQETG